MANKIGIEGAQAIVEASKEPNCLNQLTHFHVDYEDVGQDGLTIIANAFNEKICNIASLSFLYKELCAKVDKGYASTAESSTSLGSHARNDDPSLSDVKAVIGLMVLQDLMLGILCAQQNHR